MRYSKFVVLVGALATFGMCFYLGYQQVLAARKDPGKNPAAQSANLASKPIKDIYEIALTLRLNPDKETLVGTLPEKGISIYLLTHVLPETNPKTVELNYQLRSKDGKTVLSAPKIKTFLDSECRLENRYPDSPSSKSPSYYQITSLVTQAPNNTYQAKIHIVMSNVALDTSSQPK